MLNPTPQKAGSCNQYDVTGTVNVTLVSDVCSAVCDIFIETFQQNRDIDRIRQVFSDFENLFTGSFPGFYPCDTLYHDIQHTLDMSLTMARLCSAYTRHHNDLDATRFLLGLSIALFHDAGYIRQKSVDTAVNGAVYTRSHVSRSGAFLHNYLPGIGLSEHAELSLRLVHYTGYEMPIEDICVTTGADESLGILLGTADLLAQLSDRCYLEKCRDRLFPEFVLGGLATTGQRTEDDELYTSPEDLLKRTPEFFNGPVMSRLDHHFKKFYLLEKVYFNGNTPYMNAIRKNIGYLEKMISDGSFEGLRRNPPVITAG